MTRVKNLTIDSNRPTDEFRKSEREENGNFSKVDTYMLIFDQKTSRYVSSDDDVQVQVVAAMELFFEPWVKKDIDKMEMSEE